MTKEQKLSILRQVFSSSSPIKEKDFFYGRISQLEKIAEAINTEGQHAILYGERGVGKTSLANIMVKSITNVYPIKITCDRTDNSKTLWERSFENIQFSKTTKGIGFNPSETKELIHMGTQIKSIPVLRPSNIVSLLNNFGNNKLLFVFDEFDNIKNDKTRAFFADLIKSLSDNNLNSTIVLVGIADNIETLIGNHQSLERCLKQIKMPRMKKEECEEIINNGLNKLEIRIENQVRDKMIEFSSGFPHYVHLLCECGCKEIIKNGKDLFSDTYLAIAIRQGIENTSEQLRIAYRKAILTSNSSNKWRDLLFACANAEFDEFNAFTIREVVKQYARITRKSCKSGSLNYNIDQLLTEDRGEILNRIGKGKGTRYTFKNPMMRAFVKLKFHSE